jgi:allophanate hydrolase subunit 1
MSSENPIAFPSIEMVSNQACLLSFSQVISETTSNYIAQVTQHLKSLPGIVDLVPSYTTLLVVFDDYQY